MLHGEGFRRRLLECVRRVPSMACRVGREILQQIRESGKTPLLEQFRGGWVEAGRQQAVGVFP